MSKTLIIIPTYNERENLEALIKEIFKYAPDVELLITDDSSSDGTGGIADRIASNDRRVSVLHRACNRGRGLAGIDAFKEALKRKDTRYIMEMDADFSHDPKYIPSFFREIEQNDVVIGSRFIKGGRDTERNFIRVFLSKAVNFFVKKYLGLNVDDCSSGYRCFKRDVIVSINLDSLIARGPAVIEEILYIANLKKYKIKEIPIVFKARLKGKTKLNIIKLSRVFIDILHFKKAHLAGETSEALREIRGFGFRFALALNILGAIMFFRERGHFIWFTSIGSLSLLLAVLRPVTLKPIRKILDALAFSFGWLVSVVSLVAAFYLIFTPIGILARLFRKDLINQRIDKGRSSYWIERKQDIFKKTFYERMG